MTSDDVGSHNQMAQEQSWKMLIEFILSGESGSASLTTDQIIEAVQTLNWSDTPLERLKHALTQAIRNTMERSRLYGSGASLIIRVLIPEDDEVIQEAGKANDKPGQHRVSEPTTRRADWPSSYGWGFFLVQKQEDDSQASVEKSQYMIEVFLYQERKHSGK